MGHDVTVFKPYPFTIGQKIRIEDSRRAGDWEIVAISEHKVTLRCPISRKEFDWTKFCYVVDEENEDNRSQDNGGSAMEEAIEDFTRYIIFNRKIVERELPDGAPLFAWDVVRTFEMEYPVEKLYVNPSETHFVFGVYKGDAIYGDGMPGGYSAGCREAHHQADHVCEC